MRRRSLISAGAAVAWIWTALAVSAAGAQPGANEQGPSQSEREQLEQLQQLEQLESYEETEGFVLEPVPPEVQDDPWLLDGDDLDPRLFDFSLDDGSNVGGVRWGDGAEPQAPPEWSELGPDDFTPARNITVDVEGVGSSPLEDLGTLPYQLPTGPGNVVTTVRAIMPRLACSPEICRAIIGAPVTVPSSCDEAAREAVAAVRWGPRDRAREAGREYDRQCLDVVRAGPAQTSRHADPDALATAIMGVITVDGELHCMALRLDPDHIVTAYHCESRARSWQARFHPLSDPQASFALDHVRRADWPEMVKGFAAASVFLIKLENPRAAAVAAPPAPNVRLRNPSSDGEGVRIVGVYRFGDPDRTPDAEGMPRWARLLRAPAAEHCHAFPLREGDARCFVHTCPTDKGYSGAPLVSEAVDLSGDTPVVTVVGLNQGGTAYREPSDRLWRDCGSLPRDAGVLNFGSNVERPSR